MTDIEKFLYQIMSSISETNAWKDSENKEE